MGTGKKEAARREGQGKVGDGMGNVKVKGENFYRYAAAVLLSLKAVRSWRPESVADMSFQVGQESEDSEYVQRWQSATKCCRQGHESGIVSIARTTQSSD